MDDNCDPDDLAAAFFAQQAAKEKAKATLPTGDWIRVIDAVAAAKNSDRKQDAGCPSLVPGTNDRGAVDAASWLVTAMPPPPTYNHPGDRKDGIVGIMLNSEDNRCSLGKNHSKVATETNELHRNRLKKYLVQKLDEKMTETDACLNRPDPHA